MRKVKRKMFRLIRDLKDRIRKNLTIFNNITATIVGSLSAMIIWLVANMIYVDKISAMFVWESTWETV